MNDIGISVCPYVETTKIFSLTIENCSMNSFNTKIVKLINICDKLTCLRLNNVNSLTSNDIFNIHENRLKKIQTLQMNDDGKLIGDKVLKQIEKHCNSLTVLHLISKSFKLIMGKALSNIIENNQFLRDLVIENIYFPPNFLDKISTLCKHLNKLILGGSACTHKTETIATMLKTCANLTHIKIHNRNMEQRYIFEHNKTTGELILHYAHNCAEIWFPLFQLLDYITSIEFNYTEKISISGLGCMWAAHRYAAPK
jgi:hypothetical protein